jgi:hypothetical protein
MKFLSKNRTTGLIKKAMQKPQIAGAMALRMRFRPFAKKGSECKR